MRDLVSVILSLLPGTGRLLHATVGDAFAPRGVQILKLETIKPASIQPFESVRDLVADKVHDARQQIEVRRFLARMRGQALIEWKNDELKKMYEKQVALDTAGGAH